MFDYILNNKDLKEIANAAFDELISTSGVEIIFYFPPKWEECVNCSYDPIGKKSSNRWKNGGPTPFYVGSCPMCLGKYKKAVDVNISSKCTIDNSPDGRLPSFYEQKVGELRIDKGLIGTRIFSCDEDYARKCEYVKIAGASYKLAIEPFDPFLLSSRGRYKYAIWEKTSIP